jgi:hypothetical protein
VLWLAAVCSLNCVGCGGAAVTQNSKADPIQAAEVALTSLDADGDGALSDSELVDSPGLMSAMSRIDANRDGALSVDEIVQRFTKYESMSDGVAVSVLVRYNGQPLPQATVTAVPEPFMGTELQSYVGVTNDRGHTVPKGNRVELPGMPIGLYRIEIRHEGQGVDATRGVEVADDTRASEIVIEL